VTVTSGVTVIYLLIAGHGIAGLFPGAEAAPDGFDVGVPFFYQDERRTGARFFVWSGTVGDDLSVLGELLVARLQIGQGK
jgi:hypothetical protein